MLERQNRPGGCGPVGVAGPRPGRHPSAAAYTLLELQVTLVILTTGLLGLASLSAMQGRQVRHTEAWCRSEPTYYLLSQTNRWLRLLGAPAELKSQAGESPWTPPVKDKHKYDVHLDNLTQDLENQTIEADVTVAQAQGGN